MEQIIIRVPNREKARLVLEMLGSLDFVDVVREVENSLPPATDDDAFFALAGIWAGRDVTQKSLRQQA